MSEEQLDVIKDCIKIMEWMHTKVQFYSKLNMHLKLKFLAK